MPLTDRQELANVVSNALSSPVISSIFSILAPFILGYVDMFTKISLISAGITIYGILPFMHTFVRIARREKDIYVSRLNERPRNFIVGVSVYAITSLAFITVGPFYYAIFSLTSLIVATLTLAVTFRWKISIHLIGFCTPLTILTMITNGATVPLYALVPVLMWARVEVRAHSWPQAVAGAVLGTVATYYSMTLLVKVLMP